MISAIDEILHALNVLHQLLLHWFQLRVQIHQFVQLEEQLHAFLANQLLHILGDIRISYEHGELIVESADGVEQLLGILGKLFDDDDAGSQRMSTAAFVVVLSRRLLLMLMLLKVLRW